MKKAYFLFIFSLCFLSNSCKKYIQQQEQNALVSLVTNGVWVVTRYLDAGTDITPSFSGYVFHFSTNGTVTGTLGSVVANGTWSGDINTRTIVSNFPSAGDPLQKLNHTWKITDSYSDSVAANTVIDTTINVLNLHKQ
jgi:hypothetical protein